MSTQKSIPSSWVNEKNELLKRYLPKDIQQFPFYPNANFYSQYAADPLKGLHYMSTVIFLWLRIEPQGCMIDFCDEKELAKFAGDAAGVYTKIPNNKGEEIEVILINAKYKKNPLSVGAILAHEIMHLYLFRLGLKLEDVHENELLTDLATINTGLSILILNGMTYSSQWYVTIIMLAFGRIYWQSEQQAFGYFQPKEYGEHAMRYFYEHNLSAKDIIGYINPTSRHFIHSSFLLRSKGSTDFIKGLEKRHIRLNILKTMVALPFLALIIYGVSNNPPGSSTPGDLSRQIDDCKATLSSVENTINADQSRLENMDAQMTQYNNQGRIDEYNDLVNPYNALVTRVEQESADYERQLASCNSLIDTYNNRYAN